MLLQRWCTDGAVLRRGVLHVTKPLLEGTIPGCRTVGETGRGLGRRDILGEEGELGERPGTTEKEGLLRL